MRLLSYIFIMLFSVSFSLNLQAAEPDEVWTHENSKLHDRYIEVSNISYDKKTLAFADSLERVDKKYSYFSNLLRFDYAYMNLDSALFFSSSKKLQNIALKNEYYDSYFKVLTNSVYFSLNISHIFQAQILARKIIDESVKYNNNKGAYYGYLCLAQIYTSLKDLNRAIRLADDAISSINLIENLSKEQITALKVTALETKLGAYLRTNDTDLTMSVCSEILEIEPDNIYALTMLAENRFRNHDFSKFKELYNRVSKVERGGSSQYPLYYAMLQFNVFNLLLENKTAEALALSDSMPSYSEVLSKKLAIYQYVYDWENAFKILCEYDELNDSLSRESDNADVASLTAEVDVLRASMEQDKHIMIRNYHIIIISIIFVMLIILSVAIVRRVYVFKRKNTALADNIDKLLEYKQRYFEISHEKFKEEHAETLLSDDIHQSHEDEHQDVLDRFVFELTSEKLYIDPQFDRNVLIDKFDIPRRAFAKMFESRYNCSFSRYIQTLRVEYAARLIKEHPEYTIEAIAMDCGISSTVTFYRHFTDHFGITPSAYRSIKEKERA